MRIITVKKAMTDEEAKSLGGTLLDDSSYDILVDEEATVLREDGSILAILKRGVIPYALSEVAYNSLKEAAVKTTNRGMATGKGLMIRRVLKSGKVTKTRQVPVELQPNSGIVGYFDRYQRIPFCRQTTYTLRNKDKWKAVVPYVQFASNVFKENLPDRWQNQAAAIAKTKPDWYIPNSVFSTMTVNLNWQTAVHKDVGDLKEGFGVMTVIRKGNYEGGLFVFPQYRIAFNIRTGDVLIDDVHEWHGNTKIIGKKGEFNRLSVVFYYRAKLLKCLDAKGELDRAKRKQAGQSLYDDDSFNVEATVMK